MRISNEREVWNIFLARDEARIKTTDPWNRILYADRIASEVNQPVVSEYLFKNGFRPHYPGKKNFAVCISHDVDHLFQPGLSAYGRVKGASKNFFNGRWKKTLQYLDPESRINPNYNLEDLLDIETKLGIPFYFLALQPGEKDYNYSLADIKPLLQTIGKRGFEVALHGGHEAYQNADKLEQERKELQENSPSTVSGYRNHFLRFHVPVTWENLGKAGFNYDSTYGFPDHPGFRNGMCYPFFPYNVNNQRFSEILEIPLLAMDATFIFYLKYDVHKSLQLIKEIIDKTRAVNGVFTLLWHNNYLYKPWKQAFHSVISYCKDSGAWFATGEHLNQWWRENNFCGDYRRCGLREEL